MDDWRAINWSTMTHAFGSAQNVSWLMQRILETDGVERIGLIEQRTDYMTHQGELHSPAPYVLDFYVQLLKNDNLEDKSDVLWSIFLLSATLPNFSRTDVDFRVILDKIGCTMTEHMDFTPLAPPTALARRRAPPPPPCTPRRGGAPCPRRLQR